MMDIKVDLLKLYVDLFNKNTSGRGIQSKNISNKELTKNYTNQLLENLRKERYTHLVQKIFGVQI